MHKDNEKSILYLWTWIEIYSILLILRKALVHWFMLIVVFVGFEEMNHKSIAYSTECLKYRYLTKLLSKQALLNQTSV